MKTIKKLSNDKVMRVTDKKAEELTRSGAVAYCPKHEYRSSLDNAAEESPELSFQSYLKRVGESKVKPSESPAMQKHKHEWRSWLSQKIK